MVAKMGVPWALQSSGILFPSRWWSTVMSATAAAPILEALPIDFGKRFIPEAFTPLFYTQSYQELTAQQRLRYNQIHSLYFHEQIMFFETALGRRILQSLLRESWPSRLVEGLRQFLEEERQHTEMFRRLNRRCAPQLYGARDFNFIRAPRGWMAVLDWATDHPLLLRMFVWLMLLQEERSLFYSKGFLAHQGAIEPHFVEVHRRHLADEVGHVRWDEELIDLLWGRTRPLLRRMNARLFAWMLGEFFSTPKRAQLAVVRELARQLPELRPLALLMQRQMLELANDSEYRLSLYSREIVPRTFARLDEWPEFHSLRICGYHPRPKEAG